MRQTACYSQPGGHRWLGQVWQSTLVSGAKRPDRRGWPAAVRHPTGGNAAVALALLLLPWAVALAQVLRLWVPQYRLRIAFDDLALTL
jgi:hypothetical protein